jgi:spermidine synthase
LPRCGIVVGNPLPAAGCRAFPRRYIRQRKAPKGFRMAIRRSIVRGTVIATGLLAIPAAIGLAATAQPELIVRVESLYNDISLFKDGNGYYILAFGAKRLNYVESRVNPRDELELPVYYTQSMTAGLAYAAELKDAAIIGLGGGRTAWYLHKSVRGLNMTAAELDPEVVKIAGEYLNVHEEPGFDIDVRDGRIWLKKTDGLYDFILVDAYRGSFVPFHLLTSEFYKLVASKLKPGGVAAQNVEPSTMLFDSAVATIKSAFDHVDFYRGAGNIVIIAYNGPEKSEAELAKVAAERQATYGFRYDLTEIVSRRFAPEYDTTTAALTDDFAPVDDLKATARHNERPDL